MNKQTYNRLWETSSKYFSNSDVNYIPFVGKDYWLSSPKILILGESHYSEVEKREFKDQFQRYTFEVIVGEYMNLNWKYNFSSFHEFPKGMSNGVKKTFRRVANLFANQGELSKDNEYVWDSFAFYNYFQKCVGSPKFHDHSWLEEDKLSFQKMAEKAFWGERNNDYSVVNVLKPNVVIVWGEYLKSLMRKPNCKLSPALESLNCFAYESHPSIIFYPICHPSHKCWNHTKELNRFSNLRELVGFTNSFNQNTMRKEKIDYIYNKLKTKYRGKFEYLISQISLTCVLYPFENHQINKKSKNTMFLETRIEENNVSIDFYTKDFDLKNAQTILASTEFAFKKSTDNVFEEKCRLTIFDASENLEIIIKTIDDYMKLMLQWRECRK